MDYHKPPGVRWDPLLIKKALRRRQLDAKVVDGRVTFTPRPRRQDQESAAVSIEYQADRFIANVRVTFGPGANDEVVEMQFRHVLTEFGCIPLTADVESAIAREYCDDVVTIEALESEIRRHQGEKERRVACQEFAAAVRERDAQFAAMRRLDALVKKSAEDRRLI